MAARAAFVLVAAGFLLAVVAVPGVSAAHASLAGFSRETSFSTGSNSAPFPDPRGRIPTSPYEGVSTAPREDEQPELAA